MTWMGFLAAAGIACLLVVAVSLVAMNWGEQIYPPVFSALAGGSITLLVAVFATLKGAREEAQFPTVIVFDDASRKPIVLRPAQNLTTVLVRQNNLATSAWEVPDAPKTIDEMFTYGGELLQHRFLMDLRDIQRQGVGVGQMVGSSTLSVLSVPPIVKLPDPVDIAPALFVGYAGNRFSQTKGAVFDWETFGGLRAPCNTIVQLGHVANSGRGHPEKHVVTLSRKGYFKLEIGIEGIIGGGPGILPAGFEDADGKGAHATAYIYSISMTAVFEKFTSGNWRTDDYKRWTRWLMAELSRRNRVE
jgi:hypothetical protein